ncbi:unnamed protein product [Notodromas monacha]|uniref:Vitellogenin domain-containing protein n=1 Tax=Notodromas monacha TaxID=399045 RepID=A0A7R9BHN9_9CRUS|nr:unnamed protein product [Notodromas monacha]CAG0914912.1 unnamed protein product [Notodromas monacha]
MSVAPDGAPSRVLVLAAVGLFSPLLCHAFILLSHSASARQYEVGQTYTYEYFTTVILDEPIRPGISPSKNVGYQITGYVTVQAVWQSPTQRLLQISVVKYEEHLVMCGTGRRPGGHQKRRRDSVPACDANPGIICKRDPREAHLVQDYPVLDTPQLFVRSRKAPTPDGFIFHASQLSSLSLHPLYVLWSHGKISSVFYVQTDTPSLVNIKKGIASLFQDNCGEFAAAVSHGCLAEWRRKRRRRKSHSRRLKNRDDAPLINRSSINDFLRGFSWKISQLYPNFRFSEECKFDRYELTAKTVEEVDASGRCQVTYLGDATSERVIVKKKRDCRVPRSSNIISHPVPVSVGYQGRDCNSFDALTLLQALSADVVSDSEAFYSFTREESIVEEVKAQEKHSLQVHAWKVAAGRVVSDQHLKLTGSSTNSDAVDTVSLDDAIIVLARRLGQKLVSDRLSVEEEVKYCSENCLTLDQLVDQLRDGLRTNMTGTIRSSSVFLRLLSKAREAPTETLAKVLKASKNKDVMPVLMDVMAGAQTLHAHKAAMDVLNFRKDSDIELVERYLWALSVTPHPPEEIIDDMLRHAQGEIPSEKLHETVVLCLASLTDRFCAEAGNCQKKIVERVQTYLHTEVEKCKEVDCTVLYLRALNNVRTPQNVKIFLRFIETGDRKVSVAAAKALHTLPLTYLKSKDLDKLEEVYAQLRKKHDSTVRTIAADILLRKDPSIDRLGFLLSTLSDQESHELKTYIVERIRDLSELDAGLRQKLKTLVSNKTYGNYHVWGQRGRSTAFTRYLYDDFAKGSNGSFVAAMELGGGMLKRIKFDINVGEEKSLSTLLTLGVFAGGLSSFSSNNEDEEVDPEEAEESATAGIELSLLGSQLRPFVFFNGQGELMGHLWSGTASSRTPALQGVFVLHDHSQKIALSNGIMTQLNLLGGISLDLGGQVEISLWYKTAHSLIDNRAAFVIRGQATADTSFVQSQLEFNLAADSQLQLVTDSDFSDKTVMCIQMSQPQFLLKHKVRKWEHIIGQKHRLHKSLKRTHIVPGRTFVMNQKNSELCNIMFQDQDKS